MDKFDLLVFNVNLIQERERESHWHGVCILMKLAASLYCGYLSHLLQKVLKLTQKVLFTSNKKRKKKKKERKEEVVSPHLKN